MTKKELSQIYYLNKELKMWQEESQRLEESIGSHKWSDGMPKGNGISDPTGKLGAELAECKIMVAIKMVEIQVQKNKLIKYIDTISDSLMRQIVFYRCVACLNWSQVAAKIGESEDAIKKRFYRWEI